MTFTEQHPALRHRCPFCHSDPGQPCRTHRGRGHDLDSPHSRRIVLARPDLQELLARASTRQQALCCQCGQLRTVSPNYYRIDDQNRGGGLFTDPRGWFDTRTLKCGHCQAHTRHAMLSEPDKVSRDIAEEYQNYVLGGDSPHQYTPDRERLRAEYFAQFPRNPFVNHRWWKSDERQAREAGKTWFRAMCGEPVEVPEEVRENGRTITDMEAPTQIADPERAEHENLDVETGLWWTADGVCVNCLKVRHDWLLKEHRKQLLGQLLEVSATVDRMGAEDVAALREHLDRIMSNA